MLRSALFVSALAVLAAPAAAASYSATLASPATGRVVARDTNWACGAAGCQVSTVESRPAVLCQALVKKAGKVEAFLVDGRAFGEADLAKCNASVKVDGGKALSAQ
jgi:hypothetical protein